MLTDAPKLSKTFKRVLQIMILVSGAFVGVDIKVKQLSSSESCKYLSLGSVTFVMFLTDLLYDRHNFAKWPAFPQL